MSADSQKTNPCLSQVEALKLENAGLKRELRLEEADQQEGMGMAYN
jgi:hypothetical protein